MAPSPNAIGPKNPSLPATKAKATEGKDAQKPIPPKEFYGPSYCAGITEQETLTLCNLQRQRGLAYHKIREAKTSEGRAKATQAFYQAEKALHDYLR